MAKAAEGSRENYETYCQAMNTYGTKVLARVLRWYYHGGSTNYYDYLDSLEIFEMNALFSDTYKYNLRYKEPETYDFRLLHMLLEFSSDIYIDRQRRNRSDLYEVMKNNIDVIIGEGINYNKKSGTLTDAKLAENLYNVLFIYVQTLKMGAEILDLPESDYFPFIKDIQLGIMSLVAPKGKPSDRSFGTKGSTVKLSSVGMAFSDIVINSLREAMENDLKDADVDDKTVVETAFNVVLEREEEGHIFRSLAPFNFLQDKLEMPSGLEQALLENRKKSLQSSRRSSPKKLTHGESKTPSKSSSEKKNADLKDSGTSKKSTSDLQTDLKNSKASSKSLSDKQKSSIDADCNKKCKKDLDLETNNEMENTDELSQAEKAEFELELKQILKDISSYLSESSEFKAHKKITVNSFTGVTLKQHQKYSQRPGQIVKVEELLSVRGMDDDKAQIILLSGEAGMGKSWVISYIPEMFKAEKIGVDNDTLQFLFMCKLGNNKCKSLQKFVMNVCKSQIENKNIKEETILKEILEHPTLFIFDGYDESYENSVKLVTQVLEMTEVNMRVVIACRPHYVDFIYKQIPKLRKKHVCHLSLEAVPPTYHADFVNRIIDFGETGHGNTKLKQMKENLISQLPSIYEVIGEDLCNPLMLKIITMIWSEHSNA